MTTLAASKTLSKEELLDDLQRRYQLLEGERKATYETAVLNIRQNKEIVRQMKEENKILRQQIGQLRNDAPLSMDSQVEKRAGELTTTRTTLDKVRAENVRLENNLRELTSKLTELSENASQRAATDTKPMRQIRVLENRLDKALIKYNEAHSIKKTYLQIVKRLRDERVGFDTQLAAIERTLKAKEHDYEELLLLSHDAYHAKELAQAELHRFEQGVLEERNQRDREVQEKKALVQQRVQMNARLEAREQEQKKKQDLDKADELAMKTTSAMADLATSVSHTEAREERQKVVDYEEAFRRIKEACGVSEVNEVIQKFLTQDDTQNNLSLLTKELQEQIDLKLEDRKRVLAEVHELKYSSSAGSVGRQHMMDDYDIHLVEAQAKLDRNRNRYERAAALLIDVKAGIHHLAEKLQMIKLDGEPASVDESDETVEEVLSQCELKLSKLLSLTHLDNQPSRKLLKIDTVGYEEKQLAKSQADIRIKLRDSAPEDDDDDDEFEEDLEDDITSRKHVKHSCDLIVSKNEKRMKKQKKGK